MTQCHWLPQQMASSNAVLVERLPRDCAPQCRSPHWGLIGLIRENAIHTRLPHSITVSTVGYMNHA